MILEKNNRQMKFIFFVCLLLSISTAISALQCYETGNFTSGSTYADNRRVLLSSLASNATANGGFFTTAVGQGSDTVYGLALCVTNLSPQDCSSCVSSAVDGLIKSCPNQKEAISWGGDPPCIVRYANRSISGKAELDPKEIFTNTGNITSNITQFDQVWDNLIGSYLIPRASMGSTKKYAAGIADLNQIDSIYALMECTPDISQTDCRFCLQQSVKAYTSCCHGKKGGPVTRPSCFFRWDMYPFYNAFGNVSPLAPPPPPPQSTTASPPPTESIPSPSNTLTQGKKKSNTTLIAIIVSVVVFLIVIVCVLFIFVCARKRKVKGPANVEDTKGEDCEIPTVESLQYDFRTIENATQNFAPRNKLGQGGFGEVYEGTLANGEKVAVKRLSRSSRQGAEEFKNEVMLVAKLQHRNLVRLLGFCLEREEKILVYEFVPNKSLDYFLFDHEKRRQLHWSRRSDIIAGIARGMLYLHEDSRLRVIHRDLKASNVLLDENMAPKISDFGTARIFGADQTQTNTGRIVGTFGYMAPEYVVHGQISLKSDVYSFGILVLEIITGRKNSSFHQTNGTTNLVSYVWKHWRDGASMEVLDPTVMDTCSMNEVNRCIHIGLLCVQEDPADRPTMATIVLMLNSYSATVALPQEPALFLHTNTNTASLESDQSRSESPLLSVNDGTMTEPR